MAVKFVTLVSDEVLVKVTVAVETPLDDHPVKFPLKVPYEDEFPAEPLARFAYAAAT